MCKENKIFFVNGFKDGIPIGLGYFAVSFSLGIIAKKAGLTPFLGFFSSFLNHASAGEYALYNAIKGFLNHASAGEYALYNAIKACQSFFEIALIILVINARYLLMSCALSQKFSPETKMIHRIVIGFGITDELFGIAINQKGYLNPFYSYGAMSFAIPLWCLGTAFGIFAGNILPFSVVNALSVALYGMFLAIIIPPVRKSKPVFFAVLSGFTLSFLCSVIPGIKNLSEGNRTIILTILISSVLALICPCEDSE